MKYQKKCVLTQTLIIEELIKIGLNGHQRIGQAIANAIYIVNDVKHETLITFGISDDDLLQGLIKLNERINE